MKYWITGFLLFAASAGTFAQNNREGMQQIRAAKITWITNRLNLTPDQSKDFWPLFNEYENKKREIRHRIRKLNGETNNLATSEDAVRKNLKEILELRQQEVDLEKDYQGKFLKVIDVRQLAELYKADQRFTQMLLERLKDKPKDKEHD
ncbi:Spy/CpxP family protein refolding chaperone [Siphonobacter aquaeclarae]|jgi:hypothetical protein|uniref:LTXXQ motif family protein n=1 Tax=Siphonobacter aquaeclarae TaxID=563176 RepID=A0A1G9KES9_9BACT|nr:hypothetical protein [Siphonobacter aquaeclarae]MBO9639943.1 hypothetical protein [Siphonobacter aquaeclarae]SDL48112.1 hypothetical protein SAMN04488090_0991 [Siphonobacter aquaeclarae]